MKKNTLRGWLLWFTLTAVFAVMGVGFATWQDELLVSGTVTTGNLNPSFASVRPAGNNAGSVKAFISEDRKTISIYVYDGEPGDVYRLDYTVTTEGSVPVRFDLDIMSGYPGLTVKNTLPQNTLKYGESITGELKIELGGNVEEFSRYSFSIELYFKQWNMVD